MRCPKCNSVIKQFMSDEDEGSELLPEQDYKIERYINSLRSKRFELRSLTKRLKEVRKSFEPMYFHKDRKSDDLINPLFDLLISMEQMKSILEKDLNKQLLKCGQNRV